MRLAKVLLVLVMIVGLFCPTMGCTIDDGWQKGVQDGIAAAVTAMLKIPAEEIGKIIAAQIKPG
ncbi:MAG TPA: hypothetical protein VLM89_17715 [Phycisphaerae bacterium]|nr:hypothetical protein [Phycisphaerae bacterium]